MKRLPVSPDGSGLFARLQKQLSEVHSRALAEAERYIDRYLADVEKLYIAHGYERCAICDRMHKKGVKVHRKRTKT